MSKIPSFIAMWPDFDIRDFSWLNVQPNVKLFIHTEQTVHTQDSPSPHPILEANMTKFGRDCFSPQTV